MYLCIAIEKDNGSIAQLNRAFDYGSKGYRFESYWSHSKQQATKKLAACFFITPQVLLPSLEKRKKIIRPLNQKQRMMLFK